MSSLGTMMDFPLTLDHLLVRAERMFPTVPVVSRLPDRSLHRTSYGQVTRRARALAEALTRAGLRPGDRVATLMWNHAAHLETYLGVPLARGVVHTLNLRLSPEELAFIIGHAEDRFLLVDEVLVPLWEKVRPRASVERVVVVSASQGGEYEELLRTATGRWTPPKLEESDPCGMCYTSGTTGQSKGVVYTHRSTLLHTLGAALADVIGIRHADSVLPVVPMFHANAWGLPYASVMTGAKLVFPGPALDPESVLDLMTRERVTLSAGVPTVWLGVLEALDRNPGRWALAPGLRMIVGGSAAPESMLRGYDRHGITVVHAWGMTEMSPLGSVCHLGPEAEILDEAGRYAGRARQGRPSPLVEIRAVNEAGEVPWDDRTMGELQVRGPWVTARYHQNDETRDRWTADGWFRTGDVVTLDATGNIKLTDRTKDLVKSGGEWISSVDLENALMGHPAVLEAAVVAVPHPRWGERPLATVVLRRGASVTAAELQEFLRPKFAKFWVPEAIVFAEAIPRTSAGKFRKSELRERYAGWTWPATTSR
ncbi:MAG TPA: long-chain fatty acid--CoA ligase [Myxococcaceae bacterium]|nr:long-chain fatty acid--CoA ligase [Myxococcaceae bacterium]